VRWARRTWASCFGVRAVYSTVSTLWGIYVHYPLWGILVNYPISGMGFARVRPGYLQDMRYNPEVVATRTDQETSREEQLGTALSSLDQRSRDIIQRRWLTDEKPTLHELADEYGISAERVRQIEAKALTVMKNKLMA